MFKKKIKKILNNKIIIIIMAIILPFLIELIKFKKIEFNFSAILRISVVYGIYILIGIYYLLNKYSKQLGRILNGIIKNRYIIAGIALIILVALKINLSSISKWADYIEEPNCRNILLGVSRAIRSDEWLVQTPMMLSQTQGDDAYKIYNKNIAQGSLNMLMVSAPVKDILIIAKPTMWGFILFGQEYGFSFYWMFKIIAIIMISIEIVLKITKKDNILAIAGGLLLALAPAMVWWFSSSIVDGYIYGMGAVLLFGYYMNNLDIKIWKKILIGFGLLVCIPGFAFVLYPAFQVPFAFLMLIFMLNDFLPNMKKLKKIDYIIISITLIGIIGLVARYLLLCFNDMKIMMGTVYPGNRIVVGGEYSIDRFISYFANIFFPYTKAIENTCESSSFIYSFTGLIILIIYSLKNLKQDKKDSNFRLTIGLVILYIIYLIWEFIGFGETLAKLTFMSMSPTPRTHIITGILGTLITIILVKKFNGKRIFTKAQSIAISICVIIFSYVLIKNSSYASFFNFTKLEIFYVMMFSITYFLITGNKKAWCYVAIIIAIFAGATVNPICIGLKPINETDISKAIQEIKQKDENALWIGSSNILGQYLIANGVNCLNGVNTYPNFKWLNVVDSEGKYNEIYNRYAHIHVAIGDETKFELLAPDAYLVSLKYDDIKNLNIKYLYSNQEYSKDIVDKFHLENRYSDKGRNQYIYEFIQ